MSRRTYRHTRPPCVGCGERVPQVGDLCSRCCRVKRPIQACLDCGVGSFGLRCRKCNGIYLAHQGRPGRPRLTQQKIARLRAGNASYGEIAKLLGVSRQRIEQALNIQKHRARQRVRTAIVSGRLYKPDHCFRCRQDADDIEAHHDDYSKPLNVRWLCTPCHRIVHPHTDFGRNGSRPALEPAGAS